MNRIPGNPHARNLTSTGYTTETPEYAAACQVEALLALAFEQRTANLINLMRLQSDYVQAGMSMTDEAAEAIEQRLGLSSKED